MTEKVAVVAGGQSKFGARNATWRELVQEAGYELFKDVKNLDKKDVDTLFVGSAMPERFAFQSYVAPLAAETLGLRPQNIARVELACASGQSAVRMAYMAIASGLSNIAIALGVEKMTAAPMAEINTSMASALDREWDGVHGATAPPFFAMVAQRHMLEYGTTPLQMALVTVKNHRFAATNPYAHFPKEVTVEKALASPIVAAPLTLLDCCGISDGAAAVVLTKAEIAKKFTDTPIYIKGFGQYALGHNLANIPSLSNWHVLRKAAELAYKNAHIEVKDISFAELHDCFTISEIIEYEELGFCKKGEGGKFIEDGQSDIGGKIPVNTRGGLLGCGHPLGATGISQIIEVLHQFQRKVPNKRLVPNPQIAITHNLSGPSNVHSITVFGGA